MKTLIVPYYNTPSIITFVSDSFTDTQDTELSLHTGEIGASWTRHSSFTDTYAIQSNRVGKWNGSGTSAYYASGVASNLIYTVEADVIDISNDNRASGICGWMDTSTDSAIILRRQNTTTWQLLKIVSGTPSATLQSATTTFSANAVRRLKLVRYTNDMFEGFIDNVSMGSPVQITDSVFQSVGRVGLRASNNHLGFGFHVDNLLAYH